MARRAGRLWVAVCAAAWSAAAGPAVKPLTANLKVVGHVALDRGSEAGQVVVAGKTAVVAAAPPGCGAVASLSVVSLAKPRSPKVVATIPLPPGVGAAGVDALESPSLLAVALDGGACAGPGPHGLAFYDLSDPAAPRLLGRDCETCVVRERSVSLARRDDGRVLALSTELPSGAVRVLDVTNPARPEVIGSWGPGAGTGFGCDPVVSANAGRFHDEGQRAVVAGLDGGLYELDLADPARPVDAGHFAYDPSADEGNGASATAVDLGDGITVLLSDDDRDPASTSLRLDGGETMPACERGPTTVASEPSGRRSAPLIAAGRLCPGDASPGSLSGRFVLVDTDGSCPLAVRLRRARTEGAAAVVVAGGPEISASVDADFPVPVVTIDAAAAARLRAPNCCTGATLVDDPGAWGALRVISVDRANAQPPMERTQLRSPAALAFPPLDHGVHSPGPAVVSGDQAAVAWHADGLRVIDLSSNTAKATAQFIPASFGASPPDVTGAAFLPNEIVAVDAHAGLFVLRRPAEGRPTPLGEKLALAAAALGMAVAVSLVALPRLAMAWAMMRRGAGGRARRRA